MCCHWACCHFIQFTFSCSRYKCRNYGQKTHGRHKVEHGIPYIHLFRTPTLAYRRFAGISYTEFHSNQSSNSQGAGENLFTRMSHSGISRKSALFDSFFVKNSYTEGTAVSQWLRCCATNRKVAGSIPDDVSGIFH